MDPSVHFKAFSRVSVFSPRAIIKSIGVWVSSSPSPSADTLASPPRLAPLLSTGWDAEAGRVVWEGGVSWLAGIYGTMTSFPKVLLPGRTQILQNSLRAPRWALSGALGRTARCHLLLPSVRPLLFQRKELIGTQKIIGGPVSWRAEGSDFFWLLSIMLC